MPSQKKYSISLFVDKFLYFKDLFNLSDIEAINIISQPFFEKDSELIITLKDMYTTIISDEATTLLSNLARHELLEDYFLMIQHLYLKRKSKNISTERLADMCNISENTVLNMENFKTVTDITTYLKILNALNINIQIL